MRDVEAPEATSTDPAAPADVNPACRPSRPLRLLIVPEFGVGVGLAVLVLAFSVLEPSSFATLENLGNFVGDSSLLVILAMATTFVILTANLDLSIGSVVVFAEVVSVKAMIAAGGDGFSAAAVGLAVALGSGLAWGSVNGFLVARGQIPPFIVTLATLGMALGAAQLIADGNDIAQVPADLVIHVGVAKLAGVPVVALIAGVVFIAAAWTLRRTRFGRYTYAIGSDAVAAERAGIDVRRHLVKVYALAGVAYGLVAYLSLARFSTTSLGGHNGDALNAIAAVALGGTSLFGGVGTALGSLIGVFIPAVLQNGLVIASVQPYWQQIAVGVALLAALYADQVRRRSHRG
jgi:ribose transport system permease protein